MSRKGPEGFELHYATIYGARWPALRDALLKAPPVSEKAAAYAARALDVQPSDKVLDLCSAPGDKALILVEGLGEKGTLVANEVSDRKRAGLLALLDKSVPKKKRAQVEISNHDAARWCQINLNTYDRILLDAPCSTEAQMMNDATEMKLWSPARSKNLAIRQYALLSAAITSVKKGGRVVYTTTSISPSENDAIVARVLKRREADAKSITPSLDIGEVTEHGWMILPDKTGLGPIYIAILERV